MTRDQLRNHFYETPAYFKRTRDNSLFKMVNHNTIHGFIEYRKVRPDNSLGRIRLIDTTSFCKSFKPVNWL